MRELWAWFRTQSDRVVAVLAAMVGVVFVFVGWLGVSGASLTTEQVPYLASGAVGGVFALGIASTLWLSADLRDEWIKLDEISRLLRDEAGSRRADVPAGEQVDLQATNDEPSRANGRAPSRPRAGRR